MINEFSGVGYLGSLAVLPIIDLVSKKRTVVNFSVFFDHPIQQTEQRYQDNGGL